MRVIYALIGGLVISLIVLIVAYLIGALISILSSPLFIYLGLKPLRASLCTNGILLFWLLKSLAK